MLDRDLGSITDAAASTDSGSFSLIALVKRLLGKFAANGGALAVTEAGSYANLSASGLVKTGAGRLTGFICASASSGTVKIWDNTSAAATVLVNTMAVAAGTFYPVPASFSTGCYVTIAGTADLTFFYA